MQCTQHNPIRMQDLAAREQAVYSKIPGMKELLAVGKAAGMSVKVCRETAEEILEKTREVEAVYHDMKS